MSVTLWVLIALLVAVLVWAVSAYNRLVEARNRIANAFGQIDVQLKRRHDLVPNLVEVARKYLSHEAQTLEAVTLARQQAVTAANTARSQPANAGAMAVLGQAEMALGGSIGRLFALQESYPELKADLTLKALSEELTSTENRVGFARQAYNDQVLDYNDHVGRFPALIVARLFGFASAGMLESTRSEAEREAPRVSF